MAGITGTAGALRIAIDGFNLAMAHGTGVATYGVELATTLRTMGFGVEGVFGLAVPNDVGLREVAFFDQFQRLADPTRRIARWRRRLEFVRSLRPANAIEVPWSNAVEKAGFAGRLPVFDRLVTSPALFERAVTHFRITGRFLRLRIPRPPDVMHWTYPVPVTLSGARNVYTLHDLIPLKLPYTTLDDKELYGRIVARCVEQADQLCTVSESSRNDILQRFQVDPARVTNTYQAVSMPVRRTGDGEAAAAVEGIFGLPHRGYFLYFGAIEPKKNIGRLIQAYLSMRTTTPLVIVGARAWQSAQELMLMPGGGAAGGAGTFNGHRGQSVVRLDYLSRSLLSQVVRGAKAVLFPSLYEGFGLPVLEAMTLGTPVVTSLTSSLPEVVGEAGLLVDPYDVEAIVTAMQRLDHDPDLCARLSAAGMAQATRFSVAAYRERLVVLYERAMEQVA